MTDCWTNQGYS